MENSSRRDFFKKTIMALAAFALLPQSASALKRRPYATLENVKRARGNVASGADIFDALCAPENASMFKSAIICDFSALSESSDAEISKNAALLKFCKGGGELKYCARISSGLSVPKYLDEVLSGDKCAAISLFVSSLKDASSEHFIFALKKASEAGKPVYLFANVKGGEFSLETGDMLLAQCVMNLAESGIFKNFEGLKIILPHSGAALLSSLAMRSVESGDGGIYAPFMSKVFYLLDGEIPDEFFNLIKTVVPSSQFLFASSNGGAGAIERFESLPLSEAWFKRISSENAKSLF